VGCVRACICTLLGEFVFARGWQRGVTRGQIRFHSQYRVSQAKKGLEPRAQFTSKAYHPSRQACCSVLPRALSAATSCSDACRVHYNSRVGGHLVYNKIAIRGLANDRLRCVRLEIDLTNFASVELAWKN
jgi:hypothetical protein